MTNTSQPGKRVDLLAPAVIVSAIIAIFAVVTQLLNATSAASLSTTQILTAWLVAVGLIVLLWIAYMICSAYMDARAEQAEAEQARKRLDDALMAKDSAELRARAAQEQADRALAAKGAAEQEAKDAQEEAKQARTAAAEATEQPAEAMAGGDGSRRTGSRNPGEDGNGWIPPGELRHLDGTERHAKTDQVFPHGCRLELGSIALDTDPLTGKPVYRCTVVDQNPDLNGRGGATVVNVAQKPKTESWPRYPLVQFEDLQVIPYETEQDLARDRIEYALRAEEVRLAA